MIALSGWRAVLWVLAALLVVGLLLTALFWLGVVLAVLAAVASFNLFVLPRAAARFRTPELVFVVALLPVLGGVGLAAGGSGGIVTGGLVWAIGVALPRAMLWRLRHRLRRAAGSRSPLGAVRVIDTRFTLKDGG